MSMAAAKMHENSSEHMYQVEKEENSWGMAVVDGEQWGTPSMNIADWTAKPDKLTLIVEYWYKGVQAADRGEELKFECFFETLPD